MTAPSQEKLPGRRLDSPDVTEPGEATAAEPSALAEDGFGPNEWLVQEMYAAYREDPASVDRAWWDFFAEIPPSEPAHPNGQATSVTAPAGPAPAQPEEPKPAQPAESPPAQATPTKPAAPPPTQAKPAEPQPAADEGSLTRPLRGFAGRVVANMQASLGVPTATSVRAIPAKLLVDNRTIVSNHLRRSRGGKVSFTHVIGYAVVQALTDFPGMNRAYAEEGGKPSIVEPAHVNLGLAIDLKRDDGSRQLVVPSIKRAEALDFASFWSAYEDIIGKARAGSLSPDDFAGTTISLTNPGTLGTVHSVPRLMAGQGAIIGVGAMEYPAEYQGASVESLAERAISKVLTLTSTYDHRVIQGAESGDFLRRVHGLLLGEDDFYDRIYRSLRIPYEPVRWVHDIPEAHDGEVGKPARILELIHAYRVRGHLMADTNPLEFEMRRHADLDILNHGLTLWDLDRTFPTGGFGGQPTMKLRDILGVLRDSYCRTVGIEYMHIQDPQQRRWIQDRVERSHTKPDRSEQLRILARLNQSEAFETFLQTKYVGQKRFSLEGAEAMTPLLGELLDNAAETGLDEAVVGMAHRGRLNVLANIVGKSYEQIFREFEGDIDPKSTHGSGDVKYHLGAEGCYTTEDGAEIPVSLTSNPSHLEAVDPVLEGVVRAKQDIVNRGEEGYTVLPVLLHGDAAFAGQGVVAETLELSQLRGYRTGGTVHVVVNNQVGFTTSPIEGRSSVYATDVARTIQAPIFHVNGDDPEACVRVARLAFAFRQAFRKDVVVDLICYRRRGHNEADDPSLTQPLMYDLIDAKRSVRTIYTESLTGRGDISLAEAEQALRDYQERLEEVFARTREATQTPAGSTDTTPEPKPEREEVDTAVDAGVLARIAASQTDFPAGFAIHPRLQSQLEKRATMLDAQAVDWGFGETLAFGSLLLEGRPVRLAGQDSRRGTFGTRHAVVVDRHTGAVHTPLANLSGTGAGGTDQGSFYVYDSPLSEFAAMGFEYGYSVARPDALVAWEAQFGDFVVGGQTIVDEFIASGDAKWGQRSGVVLLLPHSYEGQGPDHSSARIERFLDLCAQGNMTVAQPSTPANYFHLLRRHAKSAEHRPLVVFTPKSLLRAKAATSPAQEFSEGRWRPVLDDPGTPSRPVRRVVLCSGKMYYDLAKARSKQGVDDIALVRVEQFYPMPEDEIVEVLEHYGDATDIVWAQEEPANMGAWDHMALGLPQHLEGARKLRRVSRPPAAAPAAGSMRTHDAEQQRVITNALARR